MAMNPLCNLYRDAVKLEDGMDANIAYLSGPT